MIPRNRVRLEVETPTAGLPNLLRNPSGDAFGQRAENGVAYWSEPLTPGELNPDFNNRLRSASRAVPAGTAALEMYRQTSEYPTGTEHRPVAVTAGRYVAARLDVLASQGISVGSTVPPPPMRIGLRFRNAAGADVSTTWGATVSTATSVLRVPSMVVPNTAVSASLIVQMVRAVESTNVSFAQAMVTTSSSAIPAAFAYAPPNDWLDILGKAGDITVARTPMDVGTLSAQLRGAAIDPAQVDTVRPGKLIRLRVLNGATWETVFTGKTRDGTTAYVDRSRKTRPVVAVTLIATDRGTDLANVTEPRVVIDTEGFGDLAGLMEQVMADAAVPYERDYGYSMTGNVPGRYGDNMPRNLTASLLDQVTLYRDTNQFLTYFTRYGAFHDTLSATATEVQAALHQQRRVLSDVPGATLGYVEIDRGWSTEDCINDVTVNFLRLLSGGQTQETTYGPYRNQESINKWGPRAATYTISGLTESKAVVSAFAQRILDANANPVMRCKSLKLRAETAAEVDAVVTTDHYDIFDVTHQGVTTTGLIDTITHELRVRKTGGVGWHTTYTFLTRGSTAPPTASPPPPPPVAGVGYSDWTDLELRAGFAARTSGTAPQFKIANGLMHLRGQVVRTNGANFPASDTQVGDLPLDVLTLQDRIPSLGVVSGGDTFATVRIDASGPSTRAVVWVRPATACAIVHVRGTSPL